jgi:hypothetical protein
VDRDHFLDVYDRSLLSMDKMTPQQQEGYNQCISPGAAGLAGDMDLSGPAGSGKSYVGMHVMQQTLTVDESAHVLLVVQNSAFAYFITKWLLVRLMAKQGRKKGMQQGLCRLHVLCGISMDRKCIVLDDGLLTMEAVDASAHIEYRLVLVDEAHHLDHARAAVQINKYTKDASADAPRLLLSDVSQSTSTADTWSSTLLSRGSKGGEAQQPPKRVVLSQVVRSTQRLVAGAWAFQTSDSLAKCHHNSVGPALQAFLFKANTERRIAVYAKKVLEALRLLLATYPGLDLSDRVGIITPSEAFTVQLQGLLKQAVTNFEGRSFGFVAAAEASRRVAATTRENVQCLVLDTVDNFNGLERLIVMAVDLDSPIGQGTAAKTAKTCSHLYRAMTRAQMMVVVVNEVVHGGWLEFLNRVEFDKEGDFDVEEEAKKNVKGGARGVLAQDAAEAKITLQGEQHVDEGGQRAGQQKEGVGPVGSVSRACGRQERVEKAEGHNQAQDERKEDCVTSVVWDTSMNTITSIESTPIASLKFMPLHEAQQVQQVQQAQQWLEEWRVLAELRDTTGFANWRKNKDGWDTLEEHHDPSRCAGVTMESGKITGIDLNNSNLMGALPESIGQLSCLTKLNCYGCKLTALPESICNLQNLTELEVQRNALQALPESIGNLQNLTYLDVEGNALQVLPESIGQLSSLEYLDCRSNALTVLPESIGQLSSLKFLYLGNNKLTALPESISNLQNLTLLNVQRNALQDAVKQRVRTTLPNCAAMRL